MGPLSASANVAWSSATVGYLDLNGDRFPDLVMPGLVAYTNPRGGSTCRADDGGYRACAVRDSVAAGSWARSSRWRPGLGLNGSVPSLAANSSGQTNATRGPVGPAGRVVVGLLLRGGAGAERRGGGQWRPGRRRCRSRRRRRGDGWEAADLGYVPGGTPLAMSGDAGVVQRNLADVNGDGLPDQVKVDAVRGLWVRFELGYGFTAAVAAVGGGDGV